MTLPNPLSWFHQRPQQLPVPSLKIPLRYVLTVPFMLLTVGATGLVGYLCIRNGQQAVANLAQQLMSETGDRVNLYLNDYLKTPQRVNHLNANAVGLDQIDLADPESLKRHFVQQIQVFDSVSRIHFSNPQGGYISIGNDERGLSVATTINFAAGTLQVHSVDQQGDRRKLLLEQPNYDPRQRPFYQRAVEVGQPVWTAIYVYVPASRGLGISASYPVYDERRQLQGVLSSDLTLTAIHRFLENLRVGPNGTVFIMDRSGRMVASSTAEQPFFTNASNETTPLQATASQEPAIRLSTQHLMAQFGDLSKVDRTAQLQFDIAGNRQFLQVTPFRDQFGLDWLIVVTVPESDFMGQIAANTRNTLLLSAAALVGAVFLGLLLAYWIARSIRRLSRVSQALAMGERHELLTANSPIAELQVLTDSFNQTATQLQQAFDRVKTALQESEEKFTQVFRTCPDPIGIAAPDGRYLEINDAFVELFGYTRAEVTGRTAADIGHWRNLEQQLHYKQLLQAGESVRNLECTFYNRAGAPLTVLFSADRIEIQGQMYIVGITKNITDRKQTELELQQQKELRETIYNESADAIFLVDPETLCITDCNRRAVELFEADSKAELIGIEGRTLQQRPFTSAEIDDIIAQMQEQGFWSQEVEYVTRKGSRFWGNLVAKPVEIASQAMHLVQVTDISSRKRVEEALRQNEARFQQLAAASPAIIYTVEEYPGRFVRFEYLSPAFEEIHEIPLTDALQDISLVPNSFHPDDRAGQEQAVMQALETMQPFKHEWRIITPSGKIKWIQANSRPERREDGVIVWHGVILDISDLKRAEEALKQSEQLFRGAFETSAFGISIRSMDGRYLQVNQTFCQMLGYTEAELLNMSYREITHPDDLAIDPANTIDKLTAGEVPYYHLEKRFLHKQGHTVWGLVSLSLVRDLQQNPLYFVAQIQDITDRKFAEAALRHSEAALRRAQQVAHIGSWELDVATEKVIWSEESFHIFGWDVTQPEPNLFQFYELIHPDDRSILHHKITQTITNGGSYKIDFRITQPNGSLRWAEARGEAIRNEQGQVVKLIGTNLDITERQQAGIALRQSEATKNQILKAIPDLIIWMTREGTCIDLIDGGSVTNLYTKSEAIGKNLYEILPPALAQVRMNAIEQAIGTGEVQIYEQKFSVHGSVHYEEVRVIGVGEDRVLVIVRDITERKRAEGERQRAEAALLDSETRFRSAFQDAPIGMALIGLDDRWIKVNPMLCDMLGFSESELLPLPASSLVHPDDTQKLQRCIQQVLSNENRNAQVELRYCCQQGRLAWGLVSLSLVRATQDRPLYYVAQIQDITERQAVDRLKNEFISIVSHELRTPLTAIRGFLGLLDTGLYDNKPDKAKHMIGQALTNSDRLVRLVNDILDLERLSSGKAQFVMATCQAEDLLQQAAAGVQSIADQSNVTLAIVVTPAQVWADADAILQTLTNLLSNAIKFSPPDSVITLSAQPQSNAVLFSVSDQGRGIPADKLETVFGRFQQVDVSDSRQKGGTGLGLAICQSIVQQHGGNIWAESSFGEGSTFYFTLPFPLGEEHD